MEFSGIPIVERSKKRNTLNIHVSSKNKDPNCLSNNFAIYLPSSVVDNLKGLVVNRVFIPNLINNVHINCNQVEIEISTTTTVLIDIPNGFYNINDLAQFIVDAFNIAAVTGSTLSYTYNQNTGNVTFTLSVGETFRFNATGQSKELASNKLKLTLGAPYASSKTSSENIDLYPRTQSIFIEMNFTQGNYTVAEQGDKSFLIDIPVLGVHGGLLIYKDSGDKENQIDFLNEVTMSNLRLRLLDDDNVEIPELANFDWHMNLIGLK